MKATLCLIILSTTLAFAQEKKPKQLTIHTWVREDIFSGFLFDDMERFQKGIEKLDKLLEENPNDAHALAWRGGAELYRAARAHEAGRKEEYEKFYQTATQWLERAHELQPGDVGVLATSGGSYLVSADRIPKEHSAYLWKKANERYKSLAAEQAAYADNLPLHMKGELFSGLAMSYQRIGESEKAREYLEKIVQKLPDTPYEARAKKWLEDPSARSGSIACQTCHDAGRMDNVLSRLNK